MAELSQTFVADEVEELRAQGVDVVVYGVRGGGDGHDEGVLRLPPVRLIDVLRDNARCLWQSPTGYLAFLVALLALRGEAWRTALARVPSLVLATRGVSRFHAHFAWEQAAIAAYAAALSRTPFSMTVHARDLYVARQHLPGKLRRGSPVVTVCDYNVDYLERSGLRAPDLRVVRCGVRVAPEPPVAPTGGFDVLAVGRFVEKKGVDVLLDAVSMLRVRHPGVRVGLVGTGPCEPALRAQVRRLELDGVVTFLGARPHAETLELIAAAGVLALASRPDADGDTDAAPVVLREAMARAVPVVSTRVAGIPEVVPESAGRLVEPGDPVALAGALSALLGDAALRLRLGRAGHAYVLREGNVVTEVAALRRLLVGATSTEPGRRGAARSRPVSGGSSGAVPTHPRDEMLSGGAPAG